MKPQSTILLSLAACTVYLAPARAADPPRYGWKAGEGYVYSVRIETEENGVLESLAGTCLYQLKPGEMDRLKLSCTGVLYPQQHARDGAPMVPDAPFRLLRVWPAAAGSPFTAPTRATETEIDAQGHRDGKPTLQSFGDLAGLIAEPLSTDGKTTWETAADGPVYVTVTEPLAPYAKVGRSFGKSFPATEKVTYTQSAGAGGMLSIKKHVELKAQEPEAAAPRVQWTADGNLTFDPKLGLPRALTLKGTLVDGTESTAVTLPVSISYRLLEGVERDRALSYSGGAVDDSEVKRMLVDITGNNRAQEMIAFGQIEKVRPTSGRQVVALTLEPFTADNDLFTRAAAVRALGTWGTDLTLPSMIRLTTDKEHAVRWAALDALGALADARAAEPVAARLPFDSMQASRALTAIGPPAAATVVKYLQHPEWTVRLESCKILTAIGGKATVPSLRAAARDKNGLVARAAAQALQAVSQRP